MPSDVYSVIPFSMLPNPGICRTCGSNQRDCVDFGITFDYDGAVLICVSCIQELTKLEQLGFVRREEVSAIMKQNSDLLLTQVALEMTKDELRNGMVAVLDSYDSVVADITRAGVPVPEESTPTTEKLF